MASEMVNICLYGLIISIHFILISAEDELFPGDDIQTEDENNDPWSYRRQRRPANKGTTSFNNFQSVLRDGQNIPEMQPSSLTGNADCHVEVDVTETRRLGGECIRLGVRSTFRACRSGPYLDLFSRECNNMLGDNQSDDQSTTVPSVQAQNN